MMRLGASEGTRHCLNPEGIRCEATFVEALDRSRPAGRVSILLLPDRIRGGGRGCFREGTVKYLKTGIDEESRSCGQCIVTLNNGMSGETLDRIGTDGSTLEVQSGVHKINPMGARYSIYYRP